VYTSAKTEVRDGALKLSYVYQSQGCDSFFLSPVGRVKVNGNSRKYGPGYCVLSSDEAFDKKASCPETGAQYTVGGPIWNGPLHDKAWIKGVLDLIKGRGFAAEQKIRGLLTCALEEIPDVPLHVDLHSICKVLKCSVPPHHVFKSALINAGYRASGVHSSRTALKTDAPWDFIWDVMRAWLKDHPTAKPLPEGTAGHRIAHNTPKRTDINFSRAPGSMVYKGKNNTTRFVQNPAGWGPKTMHGKKVKGGGEKEKEREKEREEKERAHDTTGEARGEKRKADATDAEDH
jgi:tRNA (guanine26-N2/guanine27-N2)-dimethyltransferase